MMDRTKVGLTQCGRYSYWLDKDRYIYQYDEERKCWMGYLCSLDAWERTFSVACDIGIYSEYSPACEKASRLQSAGWRIRIEPTGRDPRGMAQSWRMYGYAPDLAALRASGFTPHFSIV